MKKLFSIGLILCVLLLPLASCNQQEDETMLSAKMDKFIYAETMNFRYAYDHALIGRSRINAELMSKIEDVIFSSQRMNR
jgi:hypothetical protein